MSYAMPYAIMEENAIEMLQQYCKDHKLFSPLFKFEHQPNGNVVCTASVRDTIAIGNGSSKKDAKAAATSLMLQILEAMRYENNVPLEDFFYALREYCSHYGFPPPRLQYKYRGTPRGPQFIYVCETGNVQCYADSHDEWDAMQKAALYTLRTIASNEYIEFNLPALGSPVFRHKSGCNYCKKPPQSVSKPNVEEVICERHRFFDFFEDVKEDLFLLLAFENYTEKQRAETILETMRLHYQKSPIKDIDIAEPYILVEMHCDYDVIFLGPQEGHKNIYSQIITYFDGLLKK